MRETIDCSILVRMMLRVTKDTSFFINLFYVSSDFGLYIKIQQLYEGQGSPSNGIIISFSTLNQATLQSNYCFLPKCENKEVQVFLFGSS